MVCKTKKNPKWLGGVPALRSKGGADCRGWHRRAVLSVQNTQSHFTFHSFG